MRMVVAMTVGAIRDSFISDPAVFLPIAETEEIVWNRRSFPRCCPSRGQSLS